jgi:hypothetical protein
MLDAIAFKKMNIRIERQRRTNKIARDGAKRNPWKDGHSLTQP